MWRKMMIISLVRDARRRRQRLLNWMASRTPGEKSAAALTAGVFTAFNFYLGIKNDISVIKRFSEIEIKMAKIDHNRIMSEYRYNSFLFEIQKLFIEIFPDANFPSPPIPYDGFEENKDPVTDNNPFQMDEIPV